MFIEGEYTGEKQEPRRLALSISFVTIMVWLRLLQVLSASTALEDFILI